MRKPVADERSVFLNRWKSFGLSSEKEERSEDDCHSELSCNARALNPRRELQ